MPRRWWSRCVLFHELHNRDAVIVQRELLPPWQLLLLRRAAQRLLYDFDDAVFMRDSYSSRGPQSQRRRRRFTAMACAADVVIAGNEFLRSQAVQAAGRDHAYLIPTCIDPRPYPTSRHESSGAGVELVWIGSASVLKGLHALVPTLEQIGERLPGLRLKIICDRFLHLHKLSVVECPWNEAREALDLAAADIGISWMPNDAWSQGKCGLKILQYMAAGLPVVCNPVGVQANLVRHGESGFLVEAPSQWLEAIGRLARDPQLRARMGQAGRQRVEAEFSVARGAGQWLALLGDLQGRRAA